ncbi:MAG: hypothetical protein IJ776_00925 [Paludibacteraceae bacterium]|nr:hypothetical protein [Paludibacteraceae bacterium]
MKKQYNLTDKLGFGKYRYQQLRYVLQHDAKYIYWCMTNVRDFAMSDEALQFAQSCCELFVAIKPKYAVQPYAEGIDVLLSFPWKKQYLLYMRKYAEDAQVISIYALPHCPHQPIQLTLW